ncbi:MAG: hypothetical protein V4795_25205 [Pseudomonadota bacterium]
MPLRPYAARPLATSLLALALLLHPAHGADDNALKALDAAQKQGVAAFLKRQGGDGNPPSADQALVTADGRVLLQWTRYFGNSHASSLSLLERGPKGWRQAGQAELVGIVEQVRLDGDTVRVDALTLGPKDPRCCPTVKVVQRFSVASNLKPMR